MYARVKAPPISGLAPSSCSPRTEHRWDKATRHGRRVAVAIDPIPWCCARDAWCILLRARRLG